MNPTAAFLVSARNSGNDNPTRLPQILREGGWQVSVIDHEQIFMLNAQVHLGPHPANDFDLIWPLGFGPRRSFADRLQMLHLIQPAKLINPPGVYTWAHGKAAWLEHAPLSLISNQAEQLKAFMQENGGEWVLKPAAGSFGEHVQRISSAAELDHILQIQPGYWLLQRFIADIRSGETRTLICGSEILGSYLRLPTDQLHANLAQQGQALAVDVDQPAQALIDRVHQQLIHADIGFASIDTVGGYLMEVNVANPGGLATLAQVYGDAFNTEMQARLLSTLARRFR
ncbi:MAG: RimK family alpha-L-glutamate ligase [bacterium]